MFFVFIHSLFWIVSPLSLSLKRYLFCNPYKNVPECFRINEQIRPSFRSLFTDTWLRFYLGAAALLSIVFQSMRNTMVCKGKEAKTLSVVIKHSRFFSLTSRLLFTDHSVSNLTDEMATQDSRSFFGLIIFNEQIGRNAWRTIRTRWILHIFYVVFRYPSVSLRLIKACRLTINSRARRIGHSFSSSLREKKLRLHSPVFFAQTTSCSSALNWNEKIRRMTSAFRLHQTRFLPNKYF